MALKSQAAVSGRKPYSYAYSYLCRQIPGWWGSMCKIMGANLEASLKIWPLELGNVKTKGALPLCWLTVILFSPGIKRQNATHKDQIQNKVLFSVL